MPEASTVVMPADLTPQPAPAAPSDPEAKLSAETPQTPAAPEPDLWALLDKADPRELRKHPKLAGIIGSDAEAIAQRRLTQQEKDRLAQESQRQRAELRSANPFEFAKLDEQQEAEQKLREKLAAEMAPVYEEKAFSYTKAAADSVFNKLPAPIQDRLRDQTFPSVADFLDAANNARIEHEVEQRLAKDRDRYEKEARAAAEKDVVARRNGSEPSPDLGGNTSGNTRGVLAQDEWATNKSNMAWVHANRKRVQEAVSAGRIH